MFFISFSTYFSIKLESFKRKTLKMGKLSLIFISIFIYLLIVKCEKINLIKSAIFEENKHKELLSFIKNQIDLMNKKSLGNEVHDISVILKYDTENDKLGIAEKIYKIIPVKNPITKLLIQSGFKEPSMLIYVINSYLDDGNFKMV